MEGGLRLSHAELRVTCMACDTAVWHRKCMMDVLPHVTHEHERRAAVAGQRANHDTLLLTCDMSTPVRDLTAFGMSEIIFRISLVILPAPNSPLGPDTIFIEALLSGAAISAATLGSISRTMSTIAASAQTSRGESR